MRRRLRATWLLIAYLLTEVARGLGWCVGRVVRGIAIVWAAAVEGYREGRNNGRIRQD
jgi:hypothetical protein